MRANPELTVLQLRITMYLANGMTFDQIATTIDCSRSHVKQQANHARRKTDAITLPQLVSVVIARGLLVWDGERRIMVSVPDVVTSAGSSQTSILST